jgi:hypothetical protein
MGDLQRQPGFANSAWTGQRDQPHSVLRHAPEEIGDIRFSANQSTGLTREMHGRIIELSRRFSRIVARGRS